MFTLRYAVLALCEFYPACVLFWGAKVLQPLVEPDRNKNKDTFKSMLYSKNSSYIKRTIRLIIRWKRITNSKKLVHIHGTKDHTIPLRNVVHPNYTVENGSHMMI